MLLHRPAVRHRQGPDADVAIVLSGRIVHCPIDTVEGGRRRLLEGRRAHVDGDDSRERHGVRGERGAEARVPGLRGWIGGGGDASNERPDLVRPFLMGAITGCCSATVLLPSEIVKAKTQVLVGSAASSSSDVYRQMIKRHGVRSLFVGFDAQIMRDMPFYAFFFGTYELNCYLFRTYVPSMPEELNYFMSGGFAGMLGWVAAMPFDVPKTNVQASWDSKVVGSYFPELIRIARERGPLALYTGLVPTIARAFPANAALFLGVEMGKKFFDGFVWAK